MFQYRWIKKLHCLNEGSHDPDWIIITRVLLHVNFNLFYVFIHLGHSDNLAPECKLTFCPVYDAPYRFIV